MTKPVIGVFDLASNVSEGIRNTTTVFDNPARERVRLVSKRVDGFDATYLILLLQPRQVPADGVLVVGYLASIYAAMSLTTGRSLTPSAKLWVNSGCETWTMVHIARSSTLLTSVSVMVHEFRVRHS